jgi:antagonist of KipI
MLEIRDAGFLITIQDSGRTGWRRYGVPVSGAMDRWAMTAVNSLVGNPAGSAELEAGMAGGTFCADEDLLAAAGGAGWSLVVEGHDLPGWMTVKINAGRSFELRTSGKGRWGYLAIHGGLDVPPVMGSRSTYLRAGFGGWQGRALQPGDRLPVKETPIDVIDALAGNQLDPDALPDYGQAITLRVIPGPHTALFSEEGLRTFFGSEYTVSESSDRMGYRLEGEAIAHRGGADVLSLGVLPGAIQVPADGQPMVLMSDAQTTGGYALIGTVIHADLPRLAQLLPGGKLRLKETTAAEARALLEQQLGGLARELARSGSEAEISF